MSPKVQKFATKLLKDVYGKIMPSGDSSESKKVPHSIEDLASRLDELPTRDELITSFAVLQAELEREHRQTRKWLIILSVIQLAIILSVFGLVITE
jgi:hypothetical protein